ncbi:MAG: hypothetical protein U0610_22855 [bacterium]
MKIPAQVLRIQAPATHFGSDDRSVPCVVAGQAVELAQAIPIEEFVVEQVSFRVEGELVVIDDARISYDPLRSLKIDDALDVGFTGRAPDGVAVMGWDEFLERQNQSSRGS